jgi:hypothetical protein
MGLSAFAVDEDPDGDGLDGISEEICAYNK